MKRKIKRNLKRGLERMQKDGFQIEQIEINKSQGFIKIYRSFKKWEWYDNANTMRVFLHCLLKANHEETRWRGQIIDCGSFVTSYGILARELKLTVQKIRTALNKLILTNELTIKTTSHYSIITVNNWISYQSKQHTDEHTNNNPITNNQQSNNNQITTNKNEKNKRSKENKEIKKNFIAKSFFQKLFTEDEEFKKYSSFKDLFIEFLEYKTAIKKQYKTENSVRNAFLEFIRLSGGDINYGRALIDNTIARGWQSIYDLPSEQKKAFKKAQNENQSNDADDWESRCM